MTLYIEDMWMFSFRFSAIKWNGEKGNDHTEGKRKSADVRVLLSFVLVLVKRIQKELRPLFFSCFIFFTSQAGGRHVYSQMNHGWL